MLDSGIATQVFSAIKNSGANMEAFTKQFGSLSAEQRDSFLNNAATKFNINITSPAPETASLSQPQGPGPAEGELSPEQASSLPNRARAVGAIAGNTASFGIGQRVAAATEAITVPKSIMDDRSMWDRFKSNYDEIMRRGTKNVADVQAEAPGVNIPYLGRMDVVGTLGTGIGYAALAKGPLNALNFTGGALKTALSVGAQVGSAEGISQGFNAMEAIANGADSRQVATDYLKSVGTSAGASAVLAGGVRAAASPIKSTINAAGALEPALKLYADWKATKLAPEAQTLIANAEKASSIKSTSDARAKIATLNRGVAQIYSDVSKSLDQALLEQGQNLSPYVESFATQTKAALNDFAKQAVVAMDSQRPATNVLQDNLKQIASIMNNVVDTAQKSFGQELDNIAAKAPQGAKINLTPAINDFKSEMAGIDGSGIVIDRNWNVTFAPGMPPSSYEFLNKIVHTQELGIKDAILLKQDIGRTIPWSAGRDMSPGYSALTNLWNSIATKIEDPKVIGEGAVEHYKSIKDGYRQVMGVAGDATSAAKALGKASQWADEESFMGHLTSARNALDNADRLSKNLSSNGNPLNIFDAGQQAHIRDSLKALRQTIDINSVSDSNKAYNALSEMAKKYSFEDLSPQADKIKSLLDKTDIPAQFEDFRQQQEIASVIKDALDDPMNGKKVSAAKDYIGKYSGTAKPEISALLDRAAMAERIRNDTVASNIISAIKDMGSVDPDKVKSLDLALHLEPKLANLLSDAKIAEAYIQQNPKLFPSKMPTIGISGAAALMHHPVVAGISVAAMGLYDTLSNPTAALLFAERAKLKSPLLSPSTLNHFSAVANFAGRAVKLSKSKGSNATQQ